MNAGGEVAGLHRYPVKSMRGERLDAVVVDGRGIEGDRDWAVTFPDGRVGSGKTWRHLRRVPDLLHYAARTVGEGVVVVGPDGSARPVGDPGLDEELSRLAGEEVRLAREDRVTHFDVGHLHLLTRSSLAEVAERVPSGRAGVVVERFRPNLLLDLPGGPRQEEGWTGRRFAVGEHVVLEVLEPTERCVMTTLPQGELPADREILRTLVERFDTRLGAYARVVTGGPVRLGDRVRPTDT